MSSPARPRRRGRSGPGRPPRRGADGRVRERLLDAATATARERGFEGASLRQIARRAGVTPGMVAYYFGDKRGLYEAMLDATYRRLMERMRALADAPGGPGEPPLARLVELQVRTLADTPWLAPLLAREVLAHDSPLRAFFAERIASGPAVLVPALLRREIAAGRLRDDLDPVLILLSIVGMNVFPYLIHPVLGDALGYRLDDAFRDRLIAHVRALLERGLAPAGSDA